jgi:hypothetical protein
MVVFGCPHNCQVPIATAQNLEVEQLIRIFAFTKSKITNVSLRELMHQEQNTHELLERLKSTFSNLRIH